VRIALHGKPPAPFSFDADLDLEGLDLPPRAPVFVEAYRGPVTQRVPFGVVGRIAAPQERRLGQFDPGACPLFRVKVVSPDEPLGRILALADKLPPRESPDEEGERICLLHVESRDLGERLWRLELEDEWPVLAVNDRVDDLWEMARSDGLFFGLVYPEIVRRVLCEVVIERDHEDDPEDDGDWPGLWIRFVRSLTGQDHPPAGTGERARRDKEEWIREAVDGFCSRQGALERFREGRK
jgi:hypothetical protein